MRPEKQSKVGPEGHMVMLKNLGFVDFVSDRGPSKEF